MIGSCEGREPEKSIILSAWNEIRILKVFCRGLPHRGLSLSPLGWYVGRWEFAHFFRFRTLLLWPRWRRCWPPQSRMTKPVVVVSLRISHHDQFQRRRWQWPVVSLANVIQWSVKTIILLTIFENLDWAVIMTNDTNVHCKLKRGSSWSAVWSFSLPLIDVRIGLSIKHCFLQSGLVCMIHNYKRHGSEYSSLKVCLQDVFRSS